MKIGYGKSNDLDIFECLHSRTLHVYFYIISDFCDLGGFIRIMEGLFFLVL